MADNFKITHLRSASVEDGMPKKPDNLEFGELAVNYNDEKPSLFIKTSGATVGVADYLDCRITNEINDDSKSDMIPSAKVIYNLLNKWDLSLYNEYKSPRDGGRTTANSYIVSQPGTYLIPLVYGNAISKGLNNKAAYTKISGDHTHDFVNHLNNVITSPFIENHTDCIATGAELTIADTDGVFVNVKLVNGSPCRYIQFDIERVPLTNANGVISVLDDQNRVMWSWFICVRGEGVSVSEYTNHDGLTLTMMDFNLGDLYDDNEHTHTKNWLWQWGRPIPQICPAAYNSTENHPTTGRTEYSSGSTAESIAFALQHPEIFFTGSTIPYIWYAGGVSHYNLWDASCNTTGKTTSSVKSVYDPCPPGFKVPVGTAFNGFTTGGTEGSGSAINKVGDFTNGWTFKRNSSDTVGNFYPASGYRNYSSGLLSGVGTIGRYWSSASLSQYDAYYLRFNSDIVYPLNHYIRAYGHSVRGQVGF